MNVLLRFSNLTQKECRDKDFISKFREERLFCLFQGGVCEKSFRGERDTSKFNSAFNGLSRLVVSTVKSDQKMGASANARGCATNHTNLNTWKIKMTIKINVGYSN